MEIVYEDEDVEMQDYDVDMLAQELETKLRLSNVTDGEHIRGVSVLDLIDNNALRIPWSHRDSILMASHAARHQLHKGNCGTLWIDDLIRRLGMDQHARDRTYRDVLVRKLTGALVYLFRRLSLQGHIVMTPRKPHAVVWKPHTRAWARDGWDGDETPGASDDGAATGSDTSMDLAATSESSPVSANADRDGDDCIYNARPGRAWDQGTECTMSGALSEDNGRPPLSPVSENSFSLISELGGPVPSLGCLEDPFGPSPEQEPVEESAYHASNGAASSQHSDFFPGDPFCWPTAKDSAMDVDCSLSAFGHDSVPPSRTDTTSNSEDKTQSTNGPVHRLHPDNEPEAYYRDYKAQSPGHSQTHVTPFWHIQQKAASFGNIPKARKLSITPNDSMSCQDEPCLHSNTDEAPRTQSSTPLVSDKMVDWFKVTSSPTAPTQAIDAIIHKHLDIIGTPSRGQKQSPSILEKYKARAQKTNKDAIHVAVKPTARLATVPELTALPKQPPRAMPAQDVKTPGRAFLAQHHVQDFHRHDSTPPSAEHPIAFDRVQQTSGGNQVPGTATRPINTAAPSNDGCEGILKPVAPPVAIAQYSPRTPYNRRDVAPGARYPATFSRSPQTGESYQTFASYPTPETPPTSILTSRYTNNVYGIYPELPDTPSIIGKLSLGSLRNPGGAMGNPRSSAFVQKTPPTLQGNQALETPTRPATATQYPNYTFAKSSRVPDKPGPIAPVAIARPYKHDANKHPGPSPVLQNPPLNYGTAQFSRRLGAVAVHPKPTQEQISADIANLASLLRFRRCSVRDPELKEAMEERLLVCVSKYARHSAWVTLTLLSCGLDILD
ncbi:hypothetical protein AK830_g58 [Neonectria ditissima]|uniref:Uncharacterized protein n=1 Tax=Neonectria ditissima TaxID=78410 RepID=A0A0P7BYT0_9HYPO|nr:hypothetical protein AK830_g58 [Neonectria ditissima]